MDALSEIKNRLSVFTNFYDIIRIVDPLNNKVIFSDDIGCNAIDTVCYEFWKRNNVCKNCISKRAYVENNTF